MSKIIGV